ncbi:Do family serine endopeptidase [Nereida sp. MMG025]|uniref:Do family serine endopeptidase n=1 Tax=Nereida sp. MMG025 TaxID=2909981 RepID=UPI001F02C4AB|nr:Do family serine endopeptidase [Nereida sp. MMG025]MCF6443814.1 Do family serine endopeptidase [Nereida sp. MMG025]
MAVLTALAVIVMTATPSKARPDSFADLAEQISPSVVNITTSTVVAGRTGPQGIVPEGSPFEDFFRNAPGNEGPRRSSALGSGFVISEDGFIVTNNHVIEGADEIQIEFFPGDGQPTELLTATIVGTDPNTDIALLKVEADGPLKFVNFGDSSVARVGDWVMAMGNPLGQGFSVSAGIISARNRALQGTYDDYIQTDAAINRGNSGGPLFNMDGDVIGVNTAILSPNGGSIGIGFAMSSAVVTRVIDQLQEFGETRRGWLGVRIQDIEPDMVEGIEGLESVNGALITDVPDGPAKNAGLLAGDVILSFDGFDVEDTRGLVRRVGNTDVDKTVRVVVLRQGKTETLAVTLGRRETAEATAVPAAATPEEPQELEMLGLSLSELTDDMRSELGIGEGVNGLVVTNIDQSSEAYEKGLRSGDVITEAGQQALSSLSDFDDRVEEAKEAGRTSLLLLIRRDGQPRFVALSIED